MYKMPPRKSKTQTAAAISATNITTEMEKKVNTAKQPKVDDVVPVNVEESVQVTALDNDVVSKTVESIDVHFDNLYLTLTAFKQSISTMNNHLKLLERDMKTRVT